MLLNEAIKKFINRSELERAEGTIKQYEQSLKRFCIYLHNPIITNISEENVVDFFKLLQLLGYRANSFIPIQQSLIKFFRYWRKKGVYVLDYELIPRSQREYKMPVVATEEDYQKVLNSIPKRNPTLLDIRNRSILTFLEATGIRNSELCDLNLKDLDIKNRSAIIKTKKSKGIKPFREVYWIGNNEADNSLKIWLAEREKFAARIPFKDYEAVFVGVRGWQSGKRLLNTAVDIILRKLSRQARLTHTLRPHSLRHKFGHDLNNNGANAFVIKDLLGHAMVESTKIYTIMNNDETRKAYKKFKLK
jgi:integrase/recombinase XerC